MSVDYHESSDPMSEIERGLLFTRQSVEISQFQVYVTVKSKILDIRNDNYMIFIPFNSNNV